MIASLDEFYRHAENLDIPVPAAARYAKAQLEGRDPNQLAASLQRLRLYVQMMKVLDDPKQN
jgi:hypothetical protein